MSDRNNGSGGEPPSSRPHRARKRRGRPVAKTQAQKSDRSAPTASRLLATRVLDRVERTQAYADIALHHALARSGLSAADRALATELVYGTLRWRGRIDYLLSHLLNQSLDSLEPLVANTLRLGAYQILFTDRIPDRAAVDQAVRCARAVGSSRATGLVNAVLRRLVRERASLDLPQLDQDPLGHLVHALSLPEWIARRFLELFDPTEAAELATACNEPPPITIRVNRQHGSREELMEHLRSHFSEAQVSTLAPNAISLGHVGNIGLDPAFRDGRYTVQDEASQLVICMLDPQPGDFVLDTCAAPGTKTTAIAEHTGKDGFVLALDRNRRRL